MFALFILLGLSAASEIDPDLNEAVVRSIREHVADVRSLNVEDVEVGSLGLGLSPSCDGTPSVTVTSMPGEQFRGLTHVRIELSSGGVSCGRYTVSPRVELYADVAVAKAAVAAGERIEFKTRRLAHSAVRGSLVDPSVGPYVATRPIAAGDPVTHRRAKRLPAALMGSSVDIVASVGGITIKAEGRMLADANLGDRVRVANLATDTVVQGILSSPGTVLAGGRR